MTNDIETYTGERIEITFDGSRCISAAECVRGLPAVFVKKGDPWVVPDAADPDAIAEVIHRCPSGALRYRRLDGGPQEQEPALSISVQKNGPYHVRGTIPVSDHRGNPIDTGFRFALCRCGHSGNKPFCDGTHDQIEPFE